MNYYLDYRTSETIHTHRKKHQPVNYCLDYGTSEIPVPTDALPARVNYCLIYDVFETGAIAAGTLIAGELLLDLRCLRKRRSSPRPARVNYYLDYGTIETKHWGGRFL